MTEELCRQERGNGGLTELHWRDNSLWFWIVFCLFESSSGSRAHKWLFGNVIFLRYVHPQDSWSAAVFSTFFPVVSIYDLAWSSPQVCRKFSFIVIWMEVLLFWCFQPSESSQVALNLLHLPVINCNWLAFFFWHIPDQHQHIFLSLMQRLFFLLSLLEITSGRCGSKEFPRWTLKLFYYYVKLLAF